MPLYDHFHPPLSPDRSWGSFLARWTCAIGDSLNRSLPCPPYFTQIRTRSEFPDAPRLYTAEVTRSQDEQLLVDGVLELITPAIKEHEDHGDAFASKIAAYLDVGIGVLIIDIVTNPGNCPHNAIVDRLDQLSTFDLPSDWSLSAISYRPIFRDESHHIEIWTERLTLGQPLPTMPLFLRGGICVPMDLESTYAEVCDKFHIPPSSKD